MSSGKISTSIPLFENFPPVCGLTLWRLFLTHRSLFGGRWRDGIGTLRFLYNDLVHLHFIFLFLLWSVFGMTIAYDLLNTILTHNANSGSNLRFCSISQRHGPTPIPGPFQSRAIVPPAFPPSL